MFITTTKFNIPKVLENILESLQEIGAKPILVGGCVRDYFFELPIKDYDIEIFGIESLDFIQKVLEKFGSVKLVGKSFGVLTLKVDGYDFDFALPRIEEKIGNSHQDFLVTTNASLSFEEAALRRDFTINAIGYDFSKKEFLDPFDGIEDLKKRVLRHIKDETFVEDSLRVYRAIQFCARFDLAIDEKTFELCKKIVTYTTTYKNWLSTNFLQIL